MSTELSEDTKLTLDLKTIGIIVAGVLSLASMWFTLQGDINDLQNKIDNFSGDEFVKKLEFSLKDELIRSNVMQIDNATKELKEDIEENKESIKELENKVYKR
jgi:cell division protein FtsL